MISDPAAYVVPLAPGPDGAARYRATRHTAGPWSASAQHGSPPAALLARELEVGVVPDGMRISRFTLDLLGPVPVGELSVRIERVRSGRAVALVRGELVDEAGGRVVAHAGAWCVPAVDEGPLAGQEQPPGRPEDGVHHDLPPGWLPGYIDSVDWRWIDGSVATPGPATVWMRPRLPLRADEPLSPLQRVLACVDSASGISNELDIRHWDFRNTDLTVHLIRPPVGEWIAVTAQTLLAATAAGLAQARVYDAHGLVATSAQALLVRPR